MFQKAACYLGVSPGECIVVENAKAGIDAAKAAGMYAVGIREAADYEKTDYAIMSLEQLLELIKKKEESVNETV